MDMYTIILLAWSFLLFLFFFFFCFFCFAFLFCFVLFFAETVKYCQISPHFTVFYRKICIFFYSEVDILCCSCDELYEEIIDCLAAPVSDIYSSVASPICQEGQSERTFPFFPFIPDLSSPPPPIFPDFFPLFPEFWKNFCCQGWHSVHLFHLPSPARPWSGSTNWGRMILWRIMEQRKTQMSHLTHLSHSG